MEYRTQSCPEYGAFLRATHAHEALKERLGLTALDRQVTACNAAVGRATSAQGVSFEVSFTMESEQNI